MSHTYTHDTRLDGQPFDGKWRDPRLDTLEKLALQADSKKNADLKTSKPNILKRIFNKARHVSKNYTKSPTTQKMATRFARALNIAFATTLVVATNMHHEGKIEFKSGSFNNTAELAPKNSLRPVARPKVQ